MASVVKENRKGSRESFRADLTAYGAGFSIDMDKIKIGGFSGHVMTTSVELYNHRFGNGITLRQLVENWVKGLGNALYIGY